MPIRLRIGRRLCSLSMHNSILPVPNGERAVAASDFFVDLFITDLQPDEVLTGIRIATPPENSGGAYVKMRQSASGFALAGVAAQVTLDDAGNCASVAVGVTGVAPAAYRAQAVERRTCGAGY